MNFDENLADFGCCLEEEGSMSKNAAAFLKAYARTSTVLNAAAEFQQVLQKEELVRKYLDFCYEGQGGLKYQAKNAVDFGFKDGFESITSKYLPDVSRDSTNCLILVEFFTHCCINCIHSIEDVREVHEEMQEVFSNTQEVSNGFLGMKVLSIHSPKFPREKDLESIKSFCKRMKMNHSDVVNDPQCILWNEFGVTCWPTLLIFGPNPEGNGPNLLFNIMGEGHKEELMLIIRTAMDYFRCSTIQMNNNIPRAQSMDQSTVVDSGTSESISKSFLKFPGKIAMYDDQVVVADSGNNRLIVMRSSGQVEKIIGGTQKGNKDGNLIEARFYNPQGIAFASPSLFYVADTGNHSIRKVDLELNYVSTLISTGSKTKIGDEEVVLKSPWDLVFYESGTLIIAAAGNHRLFGYFFQTTTLFGIEHKENTLAVIAGSGREENRNNSYILKASFSQPSGITVVTEQPEAKVLYIADSESSSIRSITAKGQVVGVVGGSRDPTDLFAFGDADGKGINAKLQHPMGVCPGRNNSEIFVADTYNHKIKKINIESKECVKFLSDSLNEPSGICKDPIHDLIYVADTNNHCIKIINLKKARSQEMEIFLPENINIVKRASVNTMKFDKEFGVSASPDGFKLNLLLYPLPDLYEGGQWKVMPDPNINATPKSGNIQNQSNGNEGIISLMIARNHSEEAFVFYIIVDVFFCSANSCLKRTRKIKVSCTSVRDAVENTVSWKDMTWE